MSSAVKAIIFDFYGVIYLNINWDAVAERVYSHPEKFTAMRALIDQVNDGELTNSQFYEKVAHLAEDHNNAHAPAILTNPTVNMPVVEYIKDLAKSYRIALLSNGQRERLDPLVQEHGLDQIFELIISSAQFGLKKPDPAVYHAILDLLKLSAEEVVVIDDSPRHVKGAGSVGIKAIQYHSPEQLKRDLESVLGS